MTPNNSLTLSLKIQNLLRANLLQPLHAVFPFDLVQEHVDQSTVETRNRIYTAENTLLTMILVATKEDKALQNAVQVFRSVFRYTTQQVIQQAQQELDTLKDQNKEKPRKAGAPRKYKLDLPKSITNEISVNTGGFSKARYRLDLQLLNKVFEHSKNFDGIAINDLWNGRKTFITDGTYFQMQDSEDLRAKYGINKEGSVYNGAYPRGLLEGIIQQGSGCIYAYQIGTRYQSELELIYPMLNKLPTGSLLLADDLYSTYAVFCLCIRMDIDLIVPGKRKRNYKVIKTVATGDQIVELTQTDKPKWLPENYELPPKIQMRRIAYKNPETEKEHVTYTTLLDEKISMADIIAKYLTRWDIEITIREVKTIMGINVARSQTEQMVFKEFYSVFIAYNMIRKIIARSVQNTDIPPQGDILQEFYEGNKDLFIDRRGRVYNRWSPGRNGKGRD